LRRHDPWPEGRFFPEPWPAIQCLSEDGRLEEELVLPQAAYGGLQHERPECSTELTSVYNAYCYKKT